MCRISCWWDFEGLGSDTTKKHSAVPDPLAPTIFLTPLLQCSVPWALYSGVALKIQPLKMEYTALQSDWLWFSVIVSSIAKWRLQRGVTATFICGYKDRYLKIFRDYLDTFLIHPQTTLDWILLHQLRIKTIPYRYTSFQEIPQCVRLIVNAKLDTHFAMDIPWLTQTYYYKDIIGKLRCPFAIIPFQLSQWVRSKQQPHKFPWCLG